MKKRLLYLIAIVVIFVAMLFFFRPSKSDIQHELVLAEELMNERPDSSLLILENIKTGNLLGENKALYALLMTQAQFKSNKPANSDSLIKIAFEYYIIRNDSFRKAQAYFYKGRICEDLDNVKEALRYYQKASTTAKNTNNYDFMSIVYGRWGFLLNAQRLYNDAFVVLNKSLEYSVLNKDTLKQVFTLRDLGINYTAIGKYDQALFYFNRALSMAELIDNRSRISDICANIGYVYKCLSKYDEGIQYLNKSISLSQNSKFINARYCLKGDLFLLKQEYDSARYYLKLSRKHGDLGSEVNYCSLMSELENKLGNFEMALSYSNQYIKYLSKIINKEREATIAELQKKYDYSLIKNENNKLEIEKKNRDIFILLTILTFIIIVWFISFRYKKVKRGKDRIIEEEKLQLQKMADTLVERELELKKIQLKSKADLDAFQEWVLSKNEVIRKIEGLSQMGINERINNKSKMRLTSKEVENLKEVVNICFNNFAIRLVERFPSMTEENIQYCCLLKMKIPSDIIAILLGVVDGSLIKRKYRLKKEMTGMIDGCSSLEEFFLKF